MATATVRGLLRELGSSVEDDRQSSQRLVTDADTVAAQKPSAAAAEQNESEGLLRPGHPGSSSWSMQPGKAAADEKAFVVEARELVALLEHLWAVRP